MVYIGKSDRRQLLGMLAATAAWNGAAFAQQSRLPSAIDQTLLGSKSSGASAYTIDSLALAQSITVPAVHVRITVLGFANAGDGGGGQYRRVTAEPPGSGKFRSADGAWWLLDERVAYPEMFGAKGDGMNDDGDALNRWIKFPGELRLAARSYRTSQSLEGENVEIRGAGVTRSIIVFALADPKQPAMRFGRTCRLHSFAAQYDRRLLTGKEQRGERVLLATTGPNYVLQRGSEVSIRLSGCGTAISDMGEGCFSVTFNQIEISGITYAGVDFWAKSRTGNVWTNVYIGSTAAADAFTPTTMFSLAGEESQVNIQQLNLEHASCRRHVLNLENIQAAFIGTLHIEGADLENENTGYVSLKSSNVKIATASFYNTRLSKNNCSLFKIESGGSSLTGSGAKLIDIDTLNVKGIADPNWGLYPKYGADRRGLANQNAFLFFDADKDLKTRTLINIRHYNWHSYNKKDAPLYEALAVNETISLEFILKGEIPTFGPLSQRPRERLCRYRSRYFDTDKNIEWLWSEKGWIEFNRASR